MGGGVYSTASGTAAEWNFALDKNVEYPTTYRLCSFTDNSAISTGGAIETAAGKDEIMNSTFRGNSAGFGGAFRTAGAATVVVGCSFYNNVANENGGPAVVNIGSTTLKSCVFAGNIVSCEPETFLDFSQVRGGVRVRFLFLVKRLIAFILTNSNFDPRGNRLMCVCWDCDRQTAYAD